MSKKSNSPYTAAITGGGFLLEETKVLLPLLQSPDRIALLKDERVDNRLLKINAETSRKRAMAEIERRYDAMPPHPGMISSRWMRKTRKLLFSLSF